MNVTPAATFGPTAQWQPWSAVTPSGRVLWIAYYDRSYGNCEAPAATTSPWHGSTHRLGSAVARATGASPPRQCPT